MSVYVDDVRIPFGRMRMSHMIADSTDELLAMADRIGVARRWLQYPGTHREHFDVCDSKRKRAIELGALPITARELVSKTLGRAPEGSADRRLGDRLASLGGN